MISRQDVTFTSQGVACAGWLYLSDTLGPDGTAPAVAMAHGMGAVKEMHIAPIAEAIAERGVAVLLFDYRFYGASEGLPRCRLHPYDQIEDYRNALSWLAGRPEVDPSRLGVWGTSFSGGHALHLGAYDNRVKAVVAQVPAIDLYANARKVTTPEVFAGLQAMAAGDRTRRYPADEAEYIPLAAPSGQPALQSDDGTHDWLMEGQRTVAPSFENRVTLCSIEHILEYTPGRWTDRISPKPLLIVLAEDDAWTPTDLIDEAFARAGEPKALVTIPGDHYAPYSGEGRRVAGQAAADWFERWLKSKTHAALEAATE